MNGKLKLSIEVQANTQIKQIRSECATIPLILNSFRKAEISTHESPYKTTFL